MDYKEEQIQELEVLESIYPDELTQVSSAYPKIHFQINLKLDLVPSADSTFTEHSISNDHYLLLDIKFPEEYPDVAPLIEITAEELPKREQDSDEEEDDDDNDEDEQEYDDHGNPIVSTLENLPDKIHFDDFIPTLLSKVDGQVEGDMLLGMQMCFAIISNIKETSEAWFQDTLTELEKEHERKLLDREREEQKKFRGTKVTAESYLAWRTKFRKDMGLDERDNQRRLDAHNGRLSGKQIFEQGLDGGDDAEVEEDLAEGVKKL